MAYKITAEVKKGWQDWGTVTLRRDSKLIEKGLIEQRGIFKTPL